MWKVERITGAEEVELRLCGRIQGEELMELLKVIAAEDISKAVVLDLKEVKLVDQETFTFLARCEAGGTGLRNCPAYIREWIAREQRRGRPD